MTLPDQLAKVLPRATRRAWERIVPLVPQSAYLVGGTALAVHLHHRESRDLDFFLQFPEDFPSLAEELGLAGNFVATTIEDNTLNGVLDDAKIQFLVADTQRILEPTITVAGLRVAGMGDLLATKLMVISDRGELRDYFDIMTIETEAGRLTEEGLGLVVARYRPRVPEDVVSNIVRGLGYLGDVTDDLQLPVKRSVIERYWRRRQPEIIRHLDRHAESFRPVSE